MAPVVSVAPTASTLSPSAGQDTYLKSLASPPSLPPEALEQLLARARSLGIVLHHDAQVAGLLAALRLRADIPVELYAAAAAVLSCVYRASEEG